MSGVLLDLLSDLIHEDVNQRGFRNDPTRDLVNAFPHDFRLACESLARTPKPGLAIVTGFFIPTATPACGETDGPLGALFLARALVPLGFQISLVTDAFCVRALQAGLMACALHKHVPIVTLPDFAKSKSMSPEEYYHDFLTRKGIDRFTHLLAIERPGPSHTLESLQEQLGPEGALGETYLDFLNTVPSERQDRYHTMRGLDITERMSPAHHLFDLARLDGSLTTIGIGDGGNEIGMGKIAWDVIQRNIPQGGLIACRTRVEHLILAGVSNWGAYALATGVALLQGKKLDPRLFDGNVERQFLEVMVQHGPLVDGMLGKPSATVDGLAWPKYAEVLTRLDAFARQSQGRSQ